MTTIHIGTITRGVGHCWLVDIPHEVGPVGEAWTEAFTSIHRAKRTVREAYPDALILFDPMPNGGFMLFAEGD